MRHFGAARNSTSRRNKWRRARYRFEIEIKPPDSSRKITRSSGFYLELVGIFFSSHCSDFNLTSIQSWSESVTKETLDEKACKSKKIYKVEFLLFKQTYYEDARHFIFRQKFNRISLFDTSL